MPLALLVVTDPGQCPVGVSLKSTCPSQRRFLCTLSVSELCKLGHTTHARKRFPVVFLRAHDRMAFPHARCKILLSSSQIGHWTQVGKQQKGPRMAGDGKFFTTTKKGALQLLSVIDHLGCRRPGCTSMVRSSALVECSAHADSRSC